jgi:hypothetical protein
MIYILFQIAAQTGHQVTMVDVSDDVLQKSKNNISKSLQRVVKKQFADDQKVIQCFILSMSAHSPLPVAPISLVTLASMDGSHWWVTPPPPSIHAPLSLVILTLASMDQRLWWVKI